MYGCSILKSWFREFIFYTHLFCFVQQKDAIKQNKTTPIDADRDDPNIERHKRPTFCVRLEFAGGMMKKILQAISDTSCQNRRRNKQNISKNSSDFNKAMGASLDLQRAAAPMKITLVPCESQPPSSSRFWMVEIKRKLPFLGSDRCTIVQHTGNRVSEPFQGRVLSSEGRTIIKGILTDGAAEGKYFELVLSLFPEETNTSSVGASGTKNNSVCGFLQRSLKDVRGTYQITHDAFVHPMAETCDVVNQEKHNTSLMAKKKLHSSLCG